MVEEIDVMKVGVIWLHLLCEVMSFSHKASWPIINSWLLWLERKEMLRLTEPVTQ